jgi:NAD(P)-dependent dehydrogenase (short-subunit alcohol dehydrogenase family)
LNHKGALILINPDAYNQNHTSRIRGKVILVIDSGSENGRSLVTSLAEKGANIVLVYADKLPPDTLSLKEEVENLGQRCLVIAGDPSSKGFAQRAMRQNAVTFGRLDVFIDYSAQAEEQRTDNHPIFPNFAMMTAALGQMSES